MIPTIDAEGYALYWCREHQVEHRLAPCPSCQSDHAYAIEDKAFDQMLHMYPHELLGKVSE